MELNAGRRKAESERDAMKPLPEVDRAETLLVGHDLVVMHRLMEMG